MSLLAVFGLVLERLVDVYTERRGSRLTSLATWINCALYFFLPWVVSILLVVPFFYEAFDHKVESAECAWHIKDYYFVALQVGLLLMAIQPFSYLCPSFLPSLPYLHQ